MAGRNVVDAGGHAGSDEWNERRVAGKIRAHVGDEIDVEGEKTPIAVECELRRRDVVATLRVAEEMLAAVGDPFHRPREALRGQTGKCVFAVGKELGAETPNDIGGYDTTLVLGELEQVREQIVATHMAALDTRG